MFVLPKPKRDPIAGLKESYAVVAAEIYADVDSKILVTELCLANISLAVRYRAEIFGDDQKAVGDFIATALSGADMLMHNAEDLLSAGGYFDISPDKESQAETYREKVSACCERVVTVLRHVVSIADMNVVPDWFFQTEEAASPKDIFNKRMEGLVPVVARMLTSHDLRIGMLDNIALGVDGLVEAFPEKAAMFKTEAANVRIFHQNHVMRRIEIETLSERLNAWEPA